MSVVATPTAGNPSSAPRPAKEGGNTRFPASFPETEREAPRR